MAAKPAVVIVTTAPHTMEWIAAVESAAGEQFRCLKYIERVGYVTRLADDGAAIIFIDADALELASESQWRFYTVTPKTSPATRRIPIVVASDSLSIRDEALAMGANFSMSAEEVVSVIDHLLEVHARVQKSDQVEQLLSQCDEPMPPDGMESIHKFNSGEYYKQHDLFEALWMAETGPVRDLYRAILQVGIGYYQITLNNHRGAVKMLLRSVQWLEMLPDVCRGVDIKQLREDSYRVRAELERIAPEAIAQFDRSLLKPVKLVETK